MTIEDLKNHCEKQIDLCSKLNDYKHLEEHQLILNLIKENQELKEKYENAVADYETTMFEKEQLKKQVEETEKCLKDMFHINIENDKELEKAKTQQKEFIKYLEDYINSLKKEYGNYVNDNYSEEYGRYHTAKEILQKYKSIIGDINDKK